MFCNNRFIIIACGNTDQTKAYQEIRSTPEGKAYGDLHFAPGMFTKETTDGLKSGSEVAGNYSGSVQLKEVTPSFTEATVYSLGADKTDWQSGYSFQETLLVKGSPKDVDLISQVKKYLDELEDFQRDTRLNSALVLVNRRYLICLFNFTNETQAIEFVKSSLFVPRGFVIYDGFHQVSVAPGAHFSFNPRNLLNFRFDVRP